MAQEPDIRLGPGDDAPIFELELRGPNDADGNLGPVPDLSSATCTFRCQRADGDEAEFTAGVPAAGSPTLGKVRLDFKAMFGVLPFVAATDYYFRIKVVFPDGHTGSYPNGPDPTTGDGRTIDFYLLRVAADFVTVGP